MPRGTTASFNTPILSLTFAALRAALGTYVWSRMALDIAAVNPETIWLGLFKIGDRTYQSVRKGSNFSSGICPLSAASSALQNNSSFGAWRDHRLCSVTDVYASPCLLTLSATCFYDIYVVNRFGAVSCLFVSWSHQGFDFSSYRQTLTLFRDHVTNESGCPLLQHHPTALSASPFCLHPLRASLLPDWGRGVSSSRCSFPEEEGLVPLPSHPLQLLLFSAVLRHVFRPPSFGQHCHRLWHTMKDRGLVAIDQRLDVVNNQSGSKPTPPTQKKTHAPLSSGPDSSHGVHRFSHLPT